MVSRADGGDRVAIRPVRRDDRAAIVRNLAAAFADDPAMRFLFPDERQRRRHLPRLFAMLYDSHAANGLRLTTKGCEATTLWRPPGGADNAHSFGWRQRIASLWTFGEGIGRARMMGAAIESHFPPQPFWYLHIAGCAPEAQGRGFGADTIRAGLASVGEMPAYLETANPGNIAFYRGFGFEVVERWAVPDGGPAFWSMMRPPLAAATG